MPPRERISTTGLVFINVCLGAAGISTASLGETGRVGVRLEPHAQFLLPADFAWPDTVNLDIEKKYLRESAGMGTFPKEAAGVIDAMFVP